MSFVAISRFSVANGMEEEVKAAFRDRARLVDSEPGFRRLEVLSPLDHPNEIWLLTFWRDRDAFERWHHSHQYKESHRGIPKGLKLVPKSTRLDYLELVAE